MIYFNGDEYMKDNSWQYLFLYGGRASGKSTWVAGYIWHEYFCKPKANHRFMLITRSWSQAQNLEGYFSFWDKNGTIEFQGNHFYRNGKDVGFIVALTTEHNFKSSVNEDVDLAVFEEFSLYDATLYLPNEVDHFLSLMSTVFRSRDNVRCIFIGNNNNRLCNYNCYFSMFDIDFDRDNPSMGHTYEYRTQCGMWAKEDSAVALLVYVPMAYETVSEIPKMMRVLGNDVATSGGFETDEQIDEDAVVYASDWFCWEIKFPDEGYYMHFALQPDRILVDYSLYSITKHVDYAIQIDYRDVRQVRKLFDKIRRLQRYRPFRFTTYRGKYQFIIYQKDMVADETSILI